MNLQPITALSPLDGRYESKVSALREHFSEFGLIRNRVKVEIEWLKALAAAPELAEIAPFSAATIAELDGVITNFSVADGEAVKAIATDPAPPATEKVLPAAAPRRREERERVSAKFSSTAKSIRDAAKRINLFMDIKPAQVTALRTKLQDMLVELDQLQQGGAE